MQYESLHGAIAFDRQDGDVRHVAQLQMRSHRLLHCCVRLESRFHCVDRVAKDASDHSSGCTPLQQKTNASITISTSMHIQSRFISPWRMGDSTKDAIPREWALGRQTVISQASAREQMRQRGKRRSQRSLAMHSDSMRTPCLTVVVSFVAMSKQDGISTEKVLCSFADHPQPLPPPPRHVPTHTHTSTTHHLSPALEPSSRSSVRNVSDLRHCFGNCSLVLAIVVDLIVSNVVLSDCEELLDHHAIFSPTDQMHISKRSSASLV